MLSQKNVSENEQTEIIASILAIQLNITKHLTQEQMLNEQVADLLKQLSDYAKAQSLNYCPRISDAILSFGEQLSSRIFAQVLQSIGVNGEMFDVRQVMKTNASYGKAVVDLKQLSENAQQLLAPHLIDKVMVTQGFIGQDEEGYTTTLG